MKPNSKLTGKSGIYKITNTSNGKVYVGRTKCFYKRCHQYIYDFKNRTIGHINDYLYRSMKKYKIQNFTFEVLEYCSIRKTPERELYWILKLKSNVRSRGYNIRLDVNGSMVTSPETSKKISSRLKKEWREGVREGHSDKLKKSWETRDREDQSKLMTKNLTKYEYRIEGVGTVKYKKLKELGFKSAIPTFHRKKTNSILLKGVRIKRKKVSNA